MALHEALSILSCSIFIKLPGQIDYAQKLIEYFIQTFEIIYGKEFVSYNFHGFLHLCDVQDGNFHLIGKKYLSVGDLYTSPCNSSGYNVNVI